MILPQQIKITRAKPKDAKKVQSLLRETWVDTYVSKKHGISKEDIESINFLSEENIQRRTKEFSDLVPGKFTAVASIGGDLVGMCSLFVNENGGTIKAIYVTPESQRLGIGSKLFKYAMARLKKCDVINIELASYNKKAYSFYRKHGFMENGQSGEYKLPSGKSFPTICMEFRK